MDVEEFFRDEDLETQSPWEPDQGSTEWMPNIPLEEAPDSIETVLGSRCYRGRFFWEAGVSEVICAAGGLVG